MSSRINLAHVLADLGPTYSSVNVRTAAYRIEAAWYSLITVVRFSELSAEKMGNEIKETWQRLRPVTHERLRIEQTTFSYNDRQRLFEMFKNGLMEFGDLSVQLGRSVDLLSDLGYIQPASFGDPACRWPSLQVQGNTSQWLLDQNIMQTIRSADSSDEDLRRYLSTRAYSSLSEAIASFLGLNKNNHNSFASEVYLWVPILADVKRARWNPHGSVTCTYEAPPEVKSHFWLAAKISWNGSDQRELPLSPPIEAGSDWEMEVETEHIEDETARVDVALVHQSLGIINNHAWFVRDLIPHKKINPLWMLLQRFCSADEFARLLATPGLGQDSENRPQRLFEMRVSWVLSAFGFVSVLLGPHECLRDPGTRVERGSLDLIAFHPQKRVLILGACKINAAKESDYDNLVNVRALLLDDLEGAESFDTFMVVFTAAAEARLSKELETTGSGFFPRVIPVFDAQRLKGGIAALQNQQMAWIFEQLTGTLRSFQG
jgi:hypothetical protein